MTSGLRSLPPLGVLLCCAVVLAVCAEASSAGAGACWSPGVASCADCLRRGPQCAWCFQEDFLHGSGLSRRCDLPENLRGRGCHPEFMEQSEVKVEVNATLGSTQVSPRDVSITLRPGSDASFIVAVKQLERYPVDLYYLVDVSASMQENLNHLKTVGVALSLRMMEHTSDLWLGFGSFVDKPVSPYINVHPSKISNPCSDYEIRCRPAHGFHHVLSMTGNMSEFTRVIKRQRISGNMDTPEGGLDAMLQAAVCQNAVGWRPEAKRLLLLMTDQPSHLALDSRLGGIVVPHDGLCHLENNVYTGSTRMDHPSLGQLSDKLLENHIYSVFAVEKLQYQWYEELVRLLPGSYLGKLGLFQAPTLIDLVVDAYKRLLSEVAVSVSVEDEAVSRFWVSISPVCPHGSTAKDRSCSGVQPGQMVYFNITIGQHSCAKDGKDEDVTVLVRPVGYNESTVVRIRSKCQCSCGPMGRCNEDDQSPCIDQEQRSDHGHLKDSKTDPNRNCRADGSNVDCSGRGVCECGKCVCDQSRLGIIYGKYCEIDDFSCPYEQELLCGGRGACVSGECVCEDGWTGDSCGCPTSTSVCQSPDGSLCSGRGKCVCGKCVCDDPEQYGELCERCPTCQNPQQICKSVDCNHSQRLSHKEVEGFNTTCAPFADSINCVSERVSSGRLVGTFLSVCALTVLCGLVVVAVSRLLMQKRLRSPGGAGGDGGHHCPGKDLSYIPTINEKTVTYRRDWPPDHPVEMHIQVPKMPLGDSWQF
ncbi:integrin beta-8 isoform X2 [Kryptolebias marmoratus]|uniref:integrin beta-8 isoform X2 n=1 Tax=Kryptolebias marmoratus TaxID=37003 RepID=UPI000D530264|nr:integrin beta-8 isoform X2 [Kryptolebias marmoratus]